MTKREEWRRAAELAIAEYSSMARLADHLIAACDALDELIEWSGLNEEQLNGIIS